MFHGIYTALITPFKNGKVDEKAFQSFVEWQINEGVHGLVPCGTTGESPTLSYEEHKRIIALCVEVAAGRVKVMAGAGSNSTEEAIMLTGYAKDAGADGVLLVSPYYNKPTQEGLYQHYKTIAEAIDIPIVLYNVPGRSVIDIKDETIARLAKILNIVAIKDATGDLARVSKLRHLVGDAFEQISGEDMTAIGFNAMGGIGCISVTANVAPRLCAEIQNLTLKGNYAEALKIHDRLVPLHDAMFVETNPAPAKYAVSLLGKCEADLRLPLVGLSEAAKEKVKNALDLL